MTDLETLTQLFTDRGMYVTVDDRDKQTCMSVCGGTYPGYSGFVSFFEFDTEGKLVGVGGME